MDDESEIIKLSNHKKNKNIKVTTKSKKKDRKHKKSSENTAKNTMFVLLLAVVLLTAFLLRAKQTIYEREHPEEINSTKIALPAIKIPDVDTLFKNINEEVLGEFKSYLPEKLPEF